MKRKVITTADGSKTIKLEDWDEQYHSVHGAIAEANHVFIKNALLWFRENYPKETTISILEIGFGTGLNAILTSQLADLENLQINYCGIEGYPISLDEIEALNYSELLKLPKSRYSLLHSVDWEDYQIISDNFRLKKQKCLFNEIDYIEQFHIIYFDAFGARVQPELWTEKIFKKMYKALKKGGVMTTYSAKGSARRAMIASGFRVEKIEGPPNKREMLRAFKD